MKKILIALTACFAVFAASAQVGTATKEAGKATAETAKQGAEATKGAVTSPPGGRRTSMPISPCRCSYGSRLERRISVRFENERISGIYRLKAQKTCRLPEYRAGGPHRTR